MSSLKKNRSGVFHGVHDIRVDELPLQEISANGILIKIQMAGICGSDIHFYHEPMVPVGSVLGHEFTGHVIEVGHKVKDFKAGDRVVINPIHQGVGIGGSAGGFADYIMIDQVQAGVNVFHLPDSVTDKQGAMIEPLSVGLSGAHLSNTTATDHVVIFGAGTIGLAVLASLKALGVENILVSDISDARLKIAEQLGVKYTFNPTRDGNLAEYLKSIFGVAKTLFYQHEVPNVQAVIDCAGVPAIFKQGLEILAPFGRYVMLAVYTKLAEIDAFTFVDKILTLHGALGFSNEEMQQAINFVAEGKVDLSPIVTHVFPLDSLAEAFAVQADSSQSVKVLVQP